MSAGFGGSPALPTFHAIWEFALLLSEIQGGPGEQVFIGIYVGSNTPSFTDVLPVDLAYGFGDRIEFALGSRQIAFPCSPAAPTASRQRKV